MRTRSTLFLLALCFATDLVMRPFYAMGQSTLDVPLVFLFWVAMREESRLVYTVWGVLTVTRWIGSGESGLVTIAPSLIAVTALVMTRGGLNVREVSVRVVWITLATLVFQSCDVALRWSSFSDGWLEIVQGSVIAGLSGFVLIPILDVVGPPRPMR